MSDDQYPVVDLIWLVRRAMDIRKAKDWTMAERKRSWTDWTELANDTLGRVPKEKLKKTYTVRLTKIVHDALEAVVVVEATDEQDAGTVALAKATAEDSNLSWQFYEDVTDGEPEMEVISITEGDA